MHTNTTTSDSTFVQEWLCHLFFPPDVCPCATTVILPLPQRLGESCSQTRPKRRRQVSMPTSETATCWASVMLCTQQQQHSDLHAGSMLSPSNGYLRGTFPFDFVLEQGWPQLCPALSRSPWTSSSAQSLPCFLGWLQSTGPVSFSLCS